MNRHVTWANVFTHVERSEPRHEFPEALLGGRCDSYYNCVMAWRHVKCMSVLWMAWLISESHVNKYVQPFIVAV
jgi:hypothetical protein